MGMLSITRNKILNEIKKVRNQDSLGISLTDVEDQLDSREQTLTVKKKDEHRSSQCNQCSYVATAKSSLTRHVMTVHNKVKNFECENCGQEFGLKHRLKNHKRIKHGDVNCF